MDAFEGGTIVFELGGTGGELIEGQEKCEEVDILVVAQLAGSVGRHGGLHFVEKVGEGLAFPITEKFRTGQRRDLAAAFQGIAMTARAGGNVNFLSAIRLRGSIDAIL